jgi:hypothetical protein
MNEDRYQKIENTPNYQAYTFVSVGRHGELVKVVRFSEISGMTDTYNLALGTLLPDGEIDFLTIANNGDRNKILVTIAWIVGIFMEHYTGKKVYFTGSDGKRTQLYNRSIAYGYDELLKMYNLYGDISLDEEVYEFEPFEKGKTYSGFLVERK